MWAVARVCHTGGGTHVGGCFLMSPQCSDPDGGLVGRWWRSLGDSPGTPDTPAVTVVSPTRLSRPDLQLITAGPAADNDCTITDNGPCLPDAALAPPPHHTPPLPSGSLPSRRSAFPSLPIPTQARVPSPAQAPGVPPRRAPPRLTGRRSCQFLLGAAAPAQPGAATRRHRTLLGSARQRLGRREAAGGGGRQRPFKLLCDGRR